MCSSDLSSAEICIRTFPIWNADNKETPTRTKITHQGWEENIRTSFCINSEYHELKILRRITCASSGGYPIRAAPHAPIPRSTGGTATAGAADATAAGRNRARSRNRPLPNGLRPKCIPAARRRLRVHSVLRSAPGSCAFRAPTRFAGDYQTGATHRCFPVRIPRPDS